MSVELPMGILVEAPGKEVYMNGIWRNSHFGEVRQSAEAREVDEPWSSCLPNWLPQNGMSLREMDQGS